MQKSQAESSQSQRNCLFADFAHSKAAGTASLSFFPVAKVPKPPAISHYESAKPRASEKASQTIGQSSQNRQNKTAQAKNLASLLTAGDSVGLILSH